MVARPRVTRYRESMVVRRNPRVVRLSIEVFHLKHLIPFIPLGTPNSAVEFQMDSIEVGDSCEAVDSGCTNDCKRSLRAGCFLG